MTSKMHEFELVKELLDDIYTRAMQDTETYHLLSRRAIELASWLMTEAKEQKS